MTMPHFRLQKHGILHLRQLWKLLEPEITSVRVAILRPFRGRSNEASSRIPGFPHFNMAFDSEFNFRTGKLRADSRRIRGTEPGVDVAQDSMKCSNELCPIAGIPGLTGVAISNQLQACVISGCHLWLKFAYGIAPGNPADVD